MWGRPTPPEMKCRSWAEGKIFAQGRLYISLKRSRGGKGSGRTVPRRARQRSHTKNVIAYPQEPVQLLEKFALLPEDFASRIFVQFVAGHREAIRTHPTLKLSVMRLEQGHPRHSPSIHDTSPAWRLCGIFGKGAEKWRVA